MRVDPPGAVGDKPEFGVTAWQGGGKVLDPLERIGPGRYRTTKPVPVHGGWKSTLRVQQAARSSRCRSSSRDRAIPAPETPATASFTRSFQPDIVVLQRERKFDVPSALGAVAYLTVLAIALALFVLIAWSLLSRRGRAGAPRARSRTTQPRAEVV